MHEEVEEGFPPLRVCVCMCLRMVPKYQILREFVSRFLQGKEGRLSDIS